MRMVTPFSLVLLMFALAIPGWTDDQEKATKEIRKISSIAVDTNMRSLVNRAMADALKVKRLDLVKERQDANLNYGDLFLAQQLMATGAKMEDIGVQLKAGKSIFDVANENHANWKQINSDAKKLNRKIDDSIESYFTDSKKETKLDQADNYDAKTDKVAADSKITKEEFADAQFRYQHLRSLVSAQSGDDDNQGPGAQTPSAPTGRGSH